MKRKKFASVLMSIAIGTILIFSFSGCAQQSETATDEATQARQYMSNVNQTMVDLSNKLNDFNDAVADTDVVKMHTEADSAFKVLDSLSSLDAPEGYDEVKDGYVSGCDLLKDALNGYIDLYTDISSTTDGRSIDDSTYTERLSEIQKQYDDGVAKLQEADEKATELEQ